MPDACAKLVEEPRYIISSVFIISAVTSSFPGLLPILSYLIASLTSSKIGGGSGELLFKGGLKEIKFSFFL